MRNADLSRDYVRRADARLRAVDVLLEAESWADVVRESQEVVELALKALLRSAGIDPPRIHDVGDVLLAERSRFEASVAGQLETLADISRTLRRDRELAFYGAEDFTPSAFYKRADAQAARDAARMVVRTVRPYITQMVVTGCLDRSWLIVRHVDTSGTLTERYRLRGNKDVMKALTKNNNRRLVEVAGVLTADPDKTQGRGKTIQIGRNTTITTDGRDLPKQGDLKRDPTLEVSSFRVVQNDCG